MQVLGEPGSSSVAMPVARPFEKVAEWLQAPTVPSCNRSDSFREPQGSTSRDAGATSSEQRGLFDALAGMDAAAIARLVATGYLPAELAPPAQMQQTTAAANRAECPEHNHEDVCENIVDTLAPVPARLTSEALQQRRRQISDALQRKRGTIPTAHAPAEAGNAQQAVPDDSSAPAPTRELSAAAVAGARARQQLEARGWHALAVRPLTAKEPTLTRKAAMLVRCKALMATCMPSQWHLCAQLIRIQRYKCPFKV
jgi:hypothetical protein